MKKFQLGAKGFVSAIMFYALLLSANQIALSQYVCQPTGSPIVQTGSIVVADLTQNTRVFRDGIPSSCTGGTPVSAAVAGTYHYDSYTFTNPTGQAACVTVDFDFTGCGGQSTQLNAYSTFNPANAGANVIGKPGFSTIATGSLGFPLAAGASYTLVVHEVVANSGCANYSFTVTYRTNCRQAGYDRSNDGKADPTYFTPSTGTWNILNSAGGTNSLLFGLSNDIITPGDYTGDGQTDVSTYRPSTNTWFYSTSQSSPQTNVTYVQWGASGDVPVPGDYDKDGKNDIAVFRPSDGNWYILRSSNSTSFIFHWGQSGDTPVTGDYDGDLITDFAVARPTSGNYKWLVLMSSFNYGFTLGCPSGVLFCGSSPLFGLTTDRLVSGDFDGDAKTDVAVFRPTDGNWYYQRSSTITATGATGTLGVFNWGLAGDIPQPADYDGDKRTDFAVFRPSNGTWYISNSNNGAYNTFSTPVWGTATDQPATSPYRETNP
ncbi:MAG TPA: VCBS repeat-containing protein [Pyrinomonadaceae bacterium]|nr:VCBS repeat-containing protein [Pyrinomonadaceae bacterium]